MKFALFASLAFLLTACSSSLAPENELRSLHINFLVENESHVLLWIENAYQTKVRTLVDERLTPGSYSIELEMIDDNGKLLPLGMYLIYIETDDISTSRILFYSTTQDDFER